MSSLINLHTVQSSSGRENLEKKRRPKKVLLINPSSEPGMADMSLMCPHLGNLRISGWLKKRGHEVEVIDPNIEHFLRNYTLEEKFKERDWDIIGFSVLDETLITDIENMRLAKKIHPGALLVAGGIEAQFNYQTILDKSPCTIVVLGEGEVPLLMLADEEPIDSIPGIVVKNNAVPLSHEEFWEATDLIEWDKIDYETYWDYYVEKYGDQMDEQAEQEIHTARIFTKNRCPFGCNYCSSTNQLTWAAGKQSVGAVPIIGLSETNTMDIIDRIVSSHPRVKTIYFTDDDFCVLKKDVVSFCRQVVEKGYPEQGLTFMCLTRITDLNDEIIKWLQKAAFRNLNIGIETFSENVMEDIDKKCTIEDVHRNLALLRKHGLRSYMNIMLTTPKCSLDDVETTVDWTMYYIQDGFFTAGIHSACVPLKGSNYYEEFADYLTYVEQIPDTRYYVKRDYMVWAEDPYVRELQKAYFFGVDEESDRLAKAQNIVHRTSTNMAMIKLAYVKSLVVGLRAKYDLQPNFSAIQKYYREQAGLATEYDPEEYLQHVSGFYEEGVRQAGRQLVSESEDSVLIKRPGEWGLG